MNKGVNNPMWGKKHSDETKAKISQSREKYKGKKSPSWKGGRRINHNGYIELYIPGHHRARGNGYVFEHIVIAEGKYKRKIYNGEDVHHIDENKQNNEPSNLEVMSKTEHTKLHPQPKTGKTMNCPICDSEFYRKPSHVKKVNLCSLPCVGKYTNLLKKGLLKNA